MNEDRFSEQEPSPVSKNHPTKLPAWIDGEASVAEAAEIASHVERCAVCAERAAEYREVNRLVASLGAAPAPSVAIADLRRRAESAEREERHVVRWLKVMTAAAAVVLVTSLGILAYSRAELPASHQGEVAATQEEQRDDALALVFSEPWADEDL